MKNDAEQIDSAGAVTLGIALGIVTLFLGITAYSYTPVFVITSPIIIPLYAFALRRTYKILKE